MKIDKHSKKANLSNKQSDNISFYKSLYLMMEEGVVIYKMIYNDQGKPQDLQIVDMNKKIEEHFNTNAEKVKGQNLLSLVKFESIPYLDICERVIKSNISESFEDSILNPGKFYKISVIPGNDNHFALIFYDITQSKHHEQELKLSEEKYRLIVENANDGILISQNDEFIYYNGQFAEMLGYHPLEFKNITFRDIYTKTGLADLHKRNMSREKGEKLPNFYETSFKTKNGSTIEVLVRYQIINYHDLPATFAIIQDITQQKQSEKDLKEALKKAEESDRLKSAFLANMSHEIRTPMNGIMGFSKLLRKKNLSHEKHDEYIDVIEHSSKRMLNLINDLMDISKIEANQVKIYNSSINIFDMMSYFESFFKPECKAKKLKLKMSCRKNLSLISDKDKLEAILTNLIKNAIKFTEKGQITLSCEKKYDSLKFIVEDTGIGIPKDKHEDIFSRFVQADSKISKPYEGAGLGLSISKAYVELMGGKLELDSEPGLGSKFYFSLPLAQNDTLDIFNSVKTDSKDIHALNILVAEDDEPSYMYLSIIMEGFAKNIIRAHNGQEAVDICKNNPDIDLIMMDLKMPLVNGYEATKMIREFNEDIIILAQTAYAFDDDHERIIKNGFNGHLTKPIQESEVKKLLMELFR